MRFQLQPAFLMSCQSGATAVEFALIAPILFALIIGGLSTGLVVYSAAGLHDAVEQAARCYSVNASKCSTPAQAQSYAKSVYYWIEYADIYCVDPGMRTSSGSERDHATHCDYH